MTTTSAIEERVQKFLIEVTGDAALNLDSDLLTSGLLDSLTMMDLVVFIEVEFQHRISIEDMRPEQFRKIGTIAQLIERLQKNRENTQAA